MAPKLKILQLLALVIFMSFTLVLLMHVLNSGQSYYYSKSWHDPNGGSSNLQQNLINDRAGGLMDDDAMTEYINQEPSVDELMAELELKLPNVPFTYSQRHLNRTMQKSKNCAVFPYLQTLKYYNRYWQTYTNNNITFQLYGAYYDERPLVQQGPVVRILALINQLNGAFPMSYCQLWYENVEKPEIVPVIEYKVIWQWGGSKMVFPYMITCKPPKQSDQDGGPRVPQAVAVVQHQCDISSNMLKVVYEKPENPADRSTFAICVKGLDFPYADISARLVEWLELHRLMGVHKVYMYELALHPNVKKVLNYYQNKGFVELKPITLVGGVVDMPHMQHWIMKLLKFNKRVNEVIPYNDCFYRHMYKYDYIAVMDVDEVIMPLGELQTWQDIVQVAKTYENPKKCPQGFAGLCFSNTYYPFDESNFTVLASNDYQQQQNLNVAMAPDHMFMLNHQYRTSNYSKPGFATKCLHRTSNAWTIHNHYALKWLNNCRPFDFPQALAHLQHYHDITPDDKFNAVVADHSVQRYREPLIERTTRVLREVGLLK